MSPRKRITLALVALILLVVVGWFVSGGNGSAGHDALGAAESVRADRTLHEVPSEFTGAREHRGHAGAARGARGAGADADGGC
ncbi:hypothetical protein GCM10027174_33300 [Salinifilum aidingensis]